MDETNELFELNPSQIRIRLKVWQAGREHVVTHLLRRPLAADWIAYDAALATEIEHRREETELKLAGTEAADKLWDALVLATEGYRFGPEPLGTDGPEAEGSGWRDFVPIGHKRATVLQLQQVEMAESAAEEAAQGFLLDPNQDVVVLKAQRGMSYPRLVHRFHPPSKEQRMRFHKLRSDSLTVRGMKGGGGKTLLPSRMKFFLELYDQLITGVEGYSNEGQAISSAEQAREFMDAWHKRAAVQVLFGEEEAEVA